MSKVMGIEKVVRETDKSLLGNHIFREILPSLQRLDFYRSNSTLLIGDVSNYFVIATTASDKYYFMAVPGGYVTVDMDQGFEQNMTVARPPVYMTETKSIDLLTEGYTPLSRLTQQPTDIQRVYGGGKSFIP